MTAIDAASISLLLTALSLSGATGLNAWLPLLLTGALHASGAVDVAPQWDGLSDPWVLGGLAVLFVLDFVGDKVPLIDHALHAFGTVAHPVAGAIVFDAQAGADVPLLVSLLLGGGTAGALHAARATARPMVNGASGGAGAPVVSLVEDLVSLLLVALAFLLPLLAVIVLVALFFGLYRAGRRAARLAQRGRRAGGEGATTAGPPVPRSPVAGVAPPPDAATPSLAPQAPAAPSSDGGEWPPVD